MVTTLGFGLPAVGRVADFPGAGLGLLGPAAGAAIGRTVSSRPIAVIRFLIVSKRVFVPIGAHFGAHNRAVGRFRVCCDKAEPHCFPACHGDSGHVECLGKWVAGFGAASGPNVDKSPRHKG